MVMHGSPEPSYERIATAFVQAWQRYYPAVDAALCFLEHQSPLLAEMMQRRDTDRYQGVVPLFLNEGRHVRRDIPAIVGTRSSLHISRPLNDAAAVADVMMERLGVMPALAGYLLLYSHGSRDDHQTVERLAEVLRVRLEWPVNVVLASDGERRLDEVLRQARHAGATSVTIVPHFLFHGRWRQRLEESAALLKLRHGFQSIAIADALGEHPAMFALIEKRVQECLEGK